MEATVGCSRNTVKNNNVVVLIQNLSVLFSIPEKNVKFISVLFNKP